jgi:cytochrome oxidase Cu insertion factor (SCO1/SenC/PrrC family)
MTKEPCMSHVIRLIVLAVGLISVPGLREHGQAKPAPEEHAGLMVGDKAPRFTLKDQSGRERSLDEFLAKGKVALVFYRSADW